MKDKKHLQKVRELGCCICGAKPAHAHHIREGQGMGQKASDYESIPLCWYHHQGPQGIHHMGTRAWQERYGREEKLLEVTLAALKMP